MSRNPSDAMMTAWARLLRARDALVAAVERDLKAAGLPPLAWYDVLLDRAGIDLPGARLGRPALLGDDHPLAARVLRAGLAAELRWGCAPG